MIYLDHAATTPVPKEVADTVYDALVNGWGNPSSQYPTGAQARLGVDAARETLAAALDTDCRFDVVQAVHHMRKINQEIARVASLREDELFEAAKEFQVPYSLVKAVHDSGRLPVVNFAAGGVATPADAALMMQLGAEGVFVGSGIFKSGDPAKRAAAIVKAVTNYTDADLIAKLSENLGEAMVGINADEIATLMAERGK